MLHNEALTIPGISPPHSAARMGKVPLHRCVSKGLLRDRALPSKNARQGQIDCGRFHSKLWAFSSCSRESQEKGCVNMHTQLQLHALWISAHIPNPTIVNFFWLLLEIDRESNKQITAESLMAFPAPWTGSHKGNHVSPRYRSENEERHHSPELTG